jgi:DNA-binding response OmpR family regulator
VGRGSTFVIRLPVSAPAPYRSAHPTAGGAESPASALRILIVDDNCDLARGLSRLLARRGYEVHCAHTGAAALKLAQLLEPEFVLVDSNLPDLSGYEVAALLHGVSNATGLRVASFSGYSSEAERCLSRAAGCISHLQKPVDVREIEALLTEHLQTGTCSS